MHTDPRETLNGASMARLQYLVIAITAALNALDGFDVMAISFASPGIYAEWGITPAGLGFVLSMELWGMAAGSLFLGGAADQFGRKPTILACLFLMTAGMYLVTTTPSLTVLSIWRFITGLGIGGMLAAINAQAAEFSNLKNRPLAIAVMSAGYPIGGILGGAVVTQLLKYYDWRSVFYFGAVVTFLMIPLVWALMPESVHWLVRKRPANYLARINDTMTRIGHQALAMLPEFPEEARRKTWSDIFSRTMIATTVCVTAAYFLHIVTFYFILKWVPQLVVQMGFSPASAGGVLTWASVGGFLGAMTFGFLSRKINLKTLTLFMFVFSAIGTILFGQTSANLTVLSILVAFAGYFINAGIVGMYAILAEVFPTHVRASGSGFTIGVGRGGSGISPILAGFLLQSGMQLPSVAVVMAMGSLLAAGALLFLKLDSGKTQGGARVADDPALRVESAALFPGR